MAWMRTEEAGVPGIIGVMSINQAMMEAVTWHGLLPLIGSSPHQVTKAGVLGPGGVWIRSPQGQVFGMIRGPEIQHNLAWGDQDGRTIYMTAMTGLYRMRLKIPGVRP